MSTSFLVLFTARPVRGRGCPQLMLSQARLKSGLVALKQGRYKFIVYPLTPDVGKSPGPRGFIFFIC